MGDWLARIHFPDGRVIYANYSTITGSVLETLYSSYIPQGEQDENGYYPFDRGRNRVDRDSKLPEHSDLPISDPDDLIPVRVDVEASRSWTALFCPRRNQLLGPISPGMGDLIQREFLLILQNGKQHLAFDKAAQTLCGEPVSGEELPFHYLEGNGIRKPDPLPPKRDLFQEWNGGQICRACLLRATLTCRDGGWDENPPPPIPAERVTEYPGKPAGRFSALLQLVGILALIGVGVFVLRAAIGYVFPP